MTSASMPEEKKVRIASSAYERSLRPEGFKAGVIINGNPGNFSEFVNQPVIERIDLRARNVCGARGPSTCVTLGFTLRFSDGTWA